MNKTELIDAIAAQADISKAAAGRALDAAVESITGALKNGDSVSLIGFGTFYVGERAARTGRNPKTGEPAAISGKVPSCAVPANTMTLYIPISSWSHHFSIDHFCLGISHKHGGKHIYLCITKLFQCHKMVFLALSSNHGNSTAHGFR